jgi:hypothetical protein
LSFIFLFFAFLKGNLSIGLANLDVNDLPKRLRGTQALISATFFGYDDLITSTGSNFGVSFFDNSVMGLLFG